MATRPERESRPVGDRTAKVSAGDLDSTTIPPRSDNNAIIGRRYWARRMIDKASGAAIPTYGSPEWAALPEGDARRVAAVVRAAECWARGGDDLEADLRREIEAGRLAHKEAEDEDYRARAAAHRQRWGSEPARSFTERREAQLRAAQPRPNDRPAKGGEAS